MKKTIIVDVITGLFILLFAYAAVSKVLDYENFRVQLGKSSMLTLFAGWVAWMIPSIEILISLILISSSFRLAGLYASFSLMVLFTAYIIAITKFTDNVPCSCGGVLQKMSWNQHLVFNIIFVLLGIIAIILYSEKEPIRANPNTSSKI